MSSEQQETLPSVKLAFVRLEYSMAHDMREQVLPA